MDSGDMEGDEIVGRLRGKLKWREDLLIIMKEKMEERIDMIEKRGVLEENRIKMEIRERGAKIFLTEKVNSCTQMEEVNCKEDKTIQTDKEQENKAMIEELENAKKKCEEYKDELIVLEGRIKQMEEEKVKENEECEKLEKLLEQIEILKKINRNSEEKYTEITKENERLAGEMNQGKEHIKVMYDRVNKLEDEITVLEEGKWDYQENDRLTERDFVAIKADVFKEDKEYKLRRIDLERTECEILGDKDGVSRQIKHRYEVDRGMDVEELIVEEEDMETDNECNDLVYSEKEIIEAIKYSKNLELDLKEAQVMILKRDKEIKDFKDMLKDGGDNDKNEKIRLLENKLKVMVQDKIRDRRNGEEINDLKEKQISEMERDMEIKKDLIASLQLENRQQRTDLHYNDSLLMVMQSEKDVLEKRMYNLEEKMEEVLLQKGTDAMLIEDLKEENQNYKNETDELKEEIDQCKEKYDKEKTNNTELRRKLMDVKDQMEVVGIAELKRRMVKNMFENAKVKKIELSGKISKNCRLVKDTASDAHGIIIKDFFVNYEGGFIIGKDNIKRLVTIEERCKGCNKSIKPGETNEYRTKVVVANMSGVIIKVGIICIKCDENEEIIPVVARWDESDDDIENKEP